MRGEPGREAHQAGLVRLLGDDADVRAVVFQVFGDGQQQRAAACDRLRVCRRPAGPTSRGPAGRRRRPRAAASSREMAGSVRARRWRGSGCGRRVRNLRSRVSMARELGRGAAITRAPVKMGRPGGLPHFGNSHASPDLAAGGGVVVDDGDRPARFAGAARGGQAGGSGSDDQHIEGAPIHRSAPPCRARTEPGRRGRADGR